MGFPGTASVALPIAPVTLSTAPNFPTGALALSGSANVGVPIPADVVVRDYLQQTTTITFNNVSAGETLQINLPVTTTLSSVPEPASMTLMALGGARWRPVRRGCGDGNFERPPEAKTTR